MKSRFVTTVATTVVLLGACGPSRSTTTLPKLPVEATSAGAALAAPSSPRGADARGSLPASFGTIEYRLGATLPRLPATAPAYDVVASPSNADRHRIATALGLADSDRHLFLASGAGSWSFDANCQAPPDTSATVGAGQAVGFACASPATVGTVARIVCGGGPATGCTPAKPPAPVRPTDLPSEQVATDRARALFHSLGVDVAVDELHVTDGITQWFVSADPRVGGLPTTGRTVSATIGPKASILAARGFLGTPQKLGDYPLVDAATVGFKRLLEEEAHRPRPMIAMPCRADVANCGEPLTPQVVTITGVHLGLQELGADLVPVFVFEAGTNDTAPPVPAVIDGLLQTFR